MPLLEALYQSSTPDTVSYLILGYALIGGVGLLYVASLALRQRNLKRDIDVLSMMADDE